jgi:26S proteasome regulatory subunit N11
MNYRKNEFEQKMLLNLNKVNWSHSLKNRDFKDQQEDTERMIKDMAKLTAEYNKWIQEENKKTKEEFIVSSVGKLNPKNHLTQGIDEALNENVMECLGTMINTVVF